MARPGGAAAAALVDALAAVAPRFSPRAGERKLRLLRRLAARPVGGTRELLRLHDTLCFLQAYPDDRRVLAAAERALAEFPARVGRLGRRSADRLRDSGVSGTTLEYPFGFPLARWLASRFPRDADVAWERYRDRERLEAVLALLAHGAEHDAFDDFGLPWREWLRVAKGGRRLTDLQLLLELFEGAGFDAEVRDWLYESLGLPIAWRLGGAGASRTLARLAWPRPFFRRGTGLVPAGRSPVEVAREVERPLPSLRRAPRPLASALIEAARAAVGTRLRELYGFAYGNPADVLVADPGRGLRIALIGVLPERRLPYESFYGYLMLQNGVPVGYGGAWHLFGTLEFGVHIFAAFRRGESALLTTQALRVFHAALGMRTVVLEPFQVGRDNPEALASGAFYFYRGLGFRPRDPAVGRLAEREEGRIARDASYRSPLPVLRRLARAELYLSLSGADPRPEQRVRAPRLAALVTDHVARRCRGDRHAAAEAACRRVARALGVPDWRGWPRAERLAFERLSLLLALIPDLGRWPDPDRRRLARALRAKGGRSEVPYARLLDGHRRLRESLRDLLAGSGPGSVSGPSPG